MTGERNFHPDLELQLLSASDPAARASMMSYASAVAVMVTGRPDSPDDARVLVGANFGVTDASEAWFIQLTRTDGVDRMLLRFDVDDPLGPPDGLGIVRKEGGSAELYGRCRLRLPPHAARPLVIFEHERRYGHFTCAPGRNLLRVCRLPAALDQGFRRADIRLAKLAASHRLRKIANVYMGVILDGTDAP